MDLTLREGYAHWRRLGIRRGTIAAVRLVAREMRGPRRRLRLRIKPLSVSPAELAAAFGGVPARDALRGYVLAAMPTVAEFERGLDALSAEQRADLLERAGQIAAHSFDLLGSGPTDLGANIDWACDFKSGRRWPAAHISRFVVSFPDSSDVKVPWELSRFQHLPLLAAAYRLTGDRHWLDEIGAQLESWLAANPVEFGPNWACTMDVAIRGANWVAALALVADAAAAEPWFEAVCASLLLHAHFIRTHLEWGPVRGNHYLSDVVGLLCVAAMFSSSDEGRAWARWAADEVVHELDHQVLPDGCDHEASIPYHRLVTELFICGFQAADALMPGAVSDHDRQKLDRMLTFVRDYTRPDGLAPQVGDADDGRFLPLGDYGRDPRSHLHLFAQANRPYVPAARHAAYPLGGYWIARCGRLYLLVRCGDAGGGWHAHNDALSFELAFDRQPLVIDPGSYLYTADPIERTRFRSTAFHSTLELDGAEQNPISASEPFAMDDRRRSEALDWRTTALTTAFTGRHHGYESLALPATHTRRFDADGHGALLITDTVSSDGPHDARWTFPLAPCEAVVDAGIVRATFASGIVLEIAGGQVEFEITEGWHSPSYGRRFRTPFVRSRKRTEAGQDVTRIEFRVDGAL